MNPYSSSLMVNFYLTTYTVIGIFNTKNILVAVGMSEYSSEQIDIIKQNRSENFTELIGYYHTCSAVRPRCMKILNKSESILWEYQENASR